MATSAPLEVSGQDFPRLMELVARHGGVAGLTAAVARPTLRIVPPEPTPPPPPPPLPPAAAVAPLLPKSYGEVLRAVDRGICTPEEARYYFGLPTRRPARRWWRP
jgi:hypothetical protein